MLLPTHDAEQYISSQWRHNERHGVSNYRHLRVFDQPLIQAYIKENIKAPRH